MTVQTGRDGRDMQCDKNHCHSRRRQTENDYRQRYADGLCHRPAGWGTDHVGIGSCKLHGGKTSPHRVAAQRRAAEQSVEEYFAARPELVRPGVSTEQVLIEQLQRELTFVMFLRAIVHSLPADELKQLDMSGRFEKPSVWVEMLRQWEGELRETARVMDAAKVGDRLTVAVESIAGVLELTLRSVLRQLGMDPEDPRVSEALRGSLRELEGGGAA